jgi:hypothetical protein
MKNLSKNNQINDEMRPEYDFSDSVPNKYAERFKLQERFVRIDTDLFEVFDTTEKVNKALRSIIEAIPGNVKQMQQPV